MDYRVCALVQYVGLQSLTHVFMLLMQIYESKDMIEFGCFINVYL